MLVNVNMSREVADYFREYDLSAVADTLLDMYDFTNLPQITGKREVEKRVNVSNQAYIDLYETLGPRSKKISLGRLFEFAYSMDVLALPRFEQLRLADTEKKSPVASLLNKAYRTLLDAQKYDDSNELKDITSLVYEYKGVVDGISK